MKPPDRAVAIVIHNKNILLIERMNDGQHYWVMPGGGVEVNETIEEAVIREVLEETSLEVEIVKKLYIHMYNSAHMGRGDQYFFLCSYVSGDPRLGNSNEKVEMDSGRQYYKPQWVPLQSLDTLLLYPLEIRDWLIEDLKNNFKDTPKIDYIDPQNLRQGL